jgi:hypothetical protein
MWLGASGAKIYMGLGLGSATYLLYELGNTIYSVRASVSSSIK